MKQVNLTSEEWKRVVLWFKHLEADACDNEEDHDVLKKLLEQLNISK